MKRRAEIWQSSSVQVAPNERNGNVAGKKGKSTKKAKAGEKGGKKGGKKSGKK
jgi:hypothetical protein